MGIAIVAVFLNLNQTHFLNDLIAFTIHQPETIWASKISILLILVTPILGLLLVINRALFNLPLINKTCLLALAEIFVLGALSLAFAGGSFANKKKHIESCAIIKHTVAEDTLYLEGLEMPTLNEYYTEKANGMFYQFQKGKLTCLDYGFICNSNEWHLLLLLTITILAIIIICEC